MNYLLQWMKADGLTDEQRRQVWLANRWKLVDKEGEEIGVNPYLRRLVLSSRSPERNRVVYLGTTHPREARLAQRARMDLEAYLLRGWLARVRELDDHVEDMRQAFEQAQGDLERVKELAAAFVERQGAP